MLFSNIHWITGPREAQPSWLRPTLNKAWLEVWLDLENWALAPSVFFMTSCCGRSLWVNTYCLYSFGLKFIFYIPALNESLDAFFTFNLNTLLGWTTTHFLFDVILGLLSQAT